MAILIADSGATKCTWCLVEKGKKKKIVTTQGISPYFMTTEQIQAILEQELLPDLKKVSVDRVHYYGTGCAIPSNAKIVEKAVLHVFPGSEANVTNDLMAVAHATCGNEKGIVCILGTGSNSGYYNGSKIIKNSPGIGYILGDEGSGAYLGKKVIQYYLYKTFDEELTYKFDLKYNVDSGKILEQVYRKPLANRYLAGYTHFLSENRGHYMIENIIEDGLNDFFFHHLCKYSEIWRHPVHFVGSVGFVFKDVLENLCESYEFELGKIMQNPMDGLLKFLIK